MITLDVDQGEWVKAMKELQREYVIREGTKQDETSSRRIALLLGEAYITNFRNGSNVILNYPIVEKDAFDLAMEYRLTCDPLEREERVKGGVKKQILCTWGADKASGMEGYTSQLKEWTLRAFLEVPEREGEDYEPRGEANAGSRTDEELRLEEAGIG